MMRVVIFLESANTGQSTNIGELTIANEGAESALAMELEAGHFNYQYALGRRGNLSSPFGHLAEHPTATGRIVDYPADSYSVWRLVWLVLNQAMVKK